MILLYPVPASCKIANRGDLVVTNGHQCSMFNIALALMDLDHPLFPHIIVTGLLALVKFINNWNKNRKLKWSDLQTFSPAYLLLLMDIGVLESITGYATATTSRAAGYARPRCFRVPNNSSKYRRNDSSNRTVDFKRIPSKRTFFKLESGHRI